MRRIENLVAKAVLFSTVPAIVIFALSEWVLGPDWLPLLVAASWLGFVIFAYILRAIRLFRSGESEKAVFQALLLAALSLFILLSII